MADITNLRQARKRKARDAARRRGDENAVRFGRRKAEKAGADKLAALDKARLDGHRLSPGAGDRIEGDGEEAGDA